VGKNKGWWCEPAFFAYFLCGGKESECRPAQGQRLQTETTARMPVQKIKIPKQKTKKPLRGREEQNPAAERPTIT
jgi:hypothetical protein